MDLCIYCLCLFHSVPCYVSLYKPLFSVYFTLYVYPHMSTPMLSFTAIDLWTILIVVSWVLSFFRLQNEQACWCHRRVWIPPTEPREAPPCDCGGDRLAVQRQIQFSIRLMNPVGRGRQMFTWQLISIEYSWEVQALARPHLGKDTPPHKLPQVGQPYFEG